MATLNDETRTTEVAGADAALLLATTPLTFNYASGEIDPGLNDGPMLGAIKDGWGNVLYGLAVMLTLVITLLPWAIGLAILLWLWRRYGRRIFLGADPDA